MTTAAEPGTAEKAFRAYLGHTVICADCRGGVSCEPRRRLHRAWRGLCRRCAVCGTTSVPGRSAAGATIPLCDGCKPSRQGR